MPTVIPDDITKLYASRGDQASDTVWIFLQGGPDFKNNFELEAENTDGKPYDFFDDDLKVYPYQVQHINKEMKMFNDFNYEDAQKETKLALEIVRRVVQHFDKQNKVVYLIGHSYGAFLLQKVIADFGNIAERNAVLNCRLKMEEIVWKNFKEGKPVFFDSKGENPAVASDEAFKMKLKEDGMNVEEARNSSILGSAIISINFLETLKDADLKKTLFIGAQNDTAVGDWTDEEVNFLKNNAGLMFFGDGDHSSVFEYNAMKDVQNYLIGKTAVFPSN